MDIYRLFCSFLNRSNIRTDITIDPQSGNKNKANEITVIKSRAEHPELSIKAIHKENTLTLEFEAASENTFFTAFRIVMEYSGEDEDSIYISDAAYHLSRYEYSSCKMTWKDISILREMLRNRYDSNLLDAVIEIIISMVFLHRCSTGNEIIRQNREYTISSECRFDKMNEKYSKKQCFSINDTSSANEAWHPNLISIYSSLERDCQDCKTDSLDIIRSWFDYITDIGERPYSDITRHIYDSIVSSVEDYNELRAVALRRYINKKIKEHDFSSIPEEIWHQKNAKSVSQLLMTEVTSLEK